MYCEKCGKEVKKDLMGTKRDILSKIQDIEKSIKAFNSLVNETTIRTLEGSGFNTAAALIGDFKNNGAYNMLQPLEKIKKAL